MTQKVRLGQESDRLGQLRSNKKIKDEKMSKLRQVRLTRPKYVSIGQYYDRLGQIMSEKVSLGHGWGRLGQDRSSTKIKDKIR